MLVMVTKHNTERERMARQEKKVKKKAGKEGVLHKIKFLSKKRSLAFMLEVCRIQGGIHK